MVPGKAAKSHANSPQSTSGLAVGSLILGISSFFCVILTGAVAIILGIIALSKISKSNGRLAGNGLAIAGIITGAMGCLWTVVMLALLLPAVQQVRTAARRTVTMNNVRQINLANLNHDSAFNNFSSNFPGSDEDADNNLSWRVHLLPFLGREDLYQQFKLDEPWDSSHNKALLSQMPKVYAHPVIQETLAEGHTVFQFPYSSPEAETPALYIDGEIGPSFRQITDGSSNTIMIVEVAGSAAVPWTKPQDWRFDPNNPTRDLGDAFPGGCVVGMCDGSALFLPEDTNPEDVKALFTRSAGDAVNANF